MPDSRTRFEKRRMIDALDSEPPFFISITVRAIVSVRYHIKKSCATGVGFYKTSGFTRACQSAPRDDKTPKRLSFWVFSLQSALDILKTIIDSNNLPLFK